AKTGASGATAFFGRYMGGSGEMNPKEFVELQYEIISYLTVKPLKISPTSDEAVVYGTDGKGKIPAAQTPSKTDPRTPSTSKMPGLPPSRPRPRSSRLKKPPISSATSSESTATFTSIIKSLQMNTTLLQPKPSILPSPDRGFNTTDSLLIHAHAPKPKHHHQKQPSQFSNAFSSTRPKTSPNGRPRPVGGLHIHIPPPSLDSESLETSTRKPSWIPVSLIGTPLTKTQLGSTFAIAGPNSVSAATPQSVGGEYVSGAGALLEPPRLRKRSSVFRTSFVLSGGGRLSYGGGGRFGVDITLMEAGGAKKPMKVEEKRVKLLQMFHETKDVFQLKEVEKEGSKRGIVLNTVKEVLESLVADNLVKSEKIGTSNYFWSFPGEALVAKKRKLEKLAEEVVTAKKRHLELDAAIAKEKTMRNETEERQQLLAKVLALEKEQKAMKAELLQFKECDPAVLEAKEKLAKIAKTAANRWTDNIFSLQSYCSRMYNLAAEDFNKMLNIPDDFDTIP
ncbi:Meiotic nuclear division protein 1, partial [Chytridiales sp. JEL 0842]